MQFPAGTAGPRVAVRPLGDRGRGAQGFDMVRDFQSRSMCWHPPTSPPQPHDTDVSLGDRGRGLPLAHPYAPRAYSRYQQSGGQP